jgi:hypothetical protein
MLEHDRTDKTTSRKPGACHHFAADDSAILAIKAD